jgi:hypothetical protein
MAGIMAVVFDTKHPVTFYKHATILFCSSLNIFKQNLGTARIRNDRHAHLQHSRMLHWIILYYFHVPRKLILIITTFWTSKLLV